VSRVKVEGALDILILMSGSLKVDSGLRCAALGNDALPEGIAERIARAGLGVKAETEDT